MEIELIEETKEEINKRAREKAVLYDMRLHETTEFKTGAITYLVTRVPGGWIYNHVRLDSAQMNSVFIPYSNEI